MAISTVKTTLKFGTVSTTLTKMCPIKEFPDLIAKPDTIDVTDLDDDQTKSIPGLRKMDSMEFKAWYDEATYTSLVTNEGTAGFFELDFKDGASGKFAWQGSYALGVSGGSTGAAVEMTITVFPTSKVAKVTGA